MEADTVISNVFNLYLKRFVPLFAFSFIGILIIQTFLYYSGIYELLKNVNPVDIEGNVVYFLKLVIKMMVLSILVYSILNSFLINYIFIKDIDPNATPGSILGDSIRKHAIHMVFFLIIATIILVFGMAFGVVIFVVGMLVAGAYLGTALITGSAVLVVEEKNAFDSIGRSFGLAHKDFWPALGSLVLFILIMILISIIISAIVAIPVVIMFFENWRESGSIFKAFDINSYDIGVWTVVLNSIVSALVYPLYSVFSFVLYLKLKYTENQILMIND